MVIDAKSPSISAYAKSPSIIADSEGTKIVVNW